MRPPPVLQPVHGEVDMRANVQNLGLTANVVEVAALQSNPKFRQGSSVNPRGSVPEVRAAFPILPPTYQFSESHHYTKSAIPRLDRIFPSWPSPTWRHHAGPQSAMATLSSDPGHHRGRTRWAALFPSGPGGRKSPRRWRRCGPQWTNWPSVSTPRSRMRTKCPLVRPAASPKSRKIRNAVRAGHVAPRRAVRTVNLRGLAPAYRPQPAPRRPAALRTLQGKIHHAANHRALHSGEGAAFASMSGRPLTLGSSHGRRRKQAAGISTARHTSRPTLQAIHPTLDESEFPRIRKSGPNMPGA